MNHFALYLERNEIGDADFATRIGKDRTSINRWKNGKGKPTIDDAARIETETNGEVPMQSWAAVTPESEAA